MRAVVCPLLSYYQKVRFSLLLYIMLPESADSILVLYFACDTPLSLPAGNKQ